MPTKTSERYRNDGVNTEQVRELYLDLLKKCLMNTIYEDLPAPAYVIAEQLVHYTQYSAERRLAGQDWPSNCLCGGVRVRAGRIPVELPCPLFDFA